VVTSLWIALHDPEKVGFDYPAALFALLICTEFICVKYFILSFVTTQVKKTGPGLKE
jgi:hypothetical protein